MRRYLVWSLLFHLGVLTGGALLAPLRGLGGNHPAEIITVGLVDFGSPRKGMGGTASLPVPAPAGDQTVALKPAQDRTPEKLKDQQKLAGEKKEVRKDSDKHAKDSTKTPGSAALARSEAGAGVSGKLAEGSAEGDIWGVETGASVNPYHRQGFALIRSNWRNPIVGPVPRKCVILFRVKRSGEITDVEVEQKSGSDLFDGAAERAVRLTRTWPQFPSSWEEDEQIIHLEFEYRP